MTQNHGATLSVSSSTAVTTATAATTTPHSNSSTNSSSTTTALRCWVCYTDFQRGSVTSAAGVTPCHHDEMCGPCHLRLRHLHGNITCPICKALNETVICDYLPHAAASNAPHAAPPRRKLFDDYPLWGNDLGSDFIHAHDMFFPVEYYQRVVQPLLSVACTVKDCTFGTTNATSTNTTKSNTTLRQLQDHLRSAHRLTLCQYCMDGKRDFVSKLPRYAPSGLQRHWDSSPGHPVCEFCRPTRWYDLTALHVHLNRDHYKCHVCDAQGVPNQFFRHYASLERHFDQRHFLCPDPQCLAARFGVFANELDLRAHQRHVHGSGSTVSGGSNMTPLQLEFRLVRSRAPLESTADSTATAVVDYSVDGTPFVPAAVQSTRPDAALHPQHVARTEELRLRAAELRFDEQPEDAFPTLQQAHETATTGPAGMESNPRLTVGWTSNGTLQRMARSTPAGVVTDEDFPSLAGRPPKRATQAATRPAVTRPAVTRPPNWTAVGTAVPAPMAPPRTVTPHAPPPTRQSLDWSSQNFPSLAGARPARAAPLYTAAQAYAKTTVPRPHAAADNVPTLKAPPQPHAAVPLTVDQFPALDTKPKAKATHQAASSFGATPYSAAEALAQKQARERAVTLASEWNGPMPSAATAVASSSTQTLVHDVKAALGPVAYKLLKQFTRDFASRDLAADAYIDHAASLFARGYADADFWTFVPALVASCPPSADTQAALRYMDHLQRMRNGALNAEAVAAAAAMSAAVTPPSAKSGWSPGAASNLIAAAPTTLTPLTTPNSIPSGRYIPPPAAPHHRTGATKAPPKSAWGTSAQPGGAAPVGVVRAAAKPPSALSVAGAAVATTRGTATSFMAKEAKEEQWQQQQQNKASQKKKSKQKNELRALAFGN